MLTRLDTQFLWVKGIQVYSIEWDCPSPRGDIGKGVKKTLKIKNNPYRTSKGLEFTALHR
jgi:hypothetical protein